MAKRGLEFESDHRSKAGKFDPSVNDDYDVYDAINLEEESMQVDEEEENQLLEFDAVGKEDTDANDELKKKEKLEPRGLEKNELGKSDKGRETTDAALTSSCDAGNNEGRVKDESESGGRVSGRQKNLKNDDVSTSTTNGGGTRSGQKIYAPRGYQLELAGPAIDGLNSIICAPTGSGKTMTAAIVCKERMAKRKDAANADHPFKAVFVVCLRNLVAQQRDALSKYLPECDVGVLDDNQFLDAALTTFDIVVLTSQILVNALENREVPLGSLSLIILDECHHANLGHPYNKLMRLYHLEKMKGLQNPLPQILGMTASLGVGSASGLGGAKDHYVQICANLDCNRISHVRDPKNKAELEELNPKPTKNQLKMVTKRPQDKELYEVMENLMKEVETKYLNLDVLQAQRGTQMYESAVSTLKQEAEKTKERVEEMVACEALLKFNSAWMIHDELRTKDALQLLDKYFEENLESKPGAVEKVLCQCYSDARRHLRRIESQETLKDWPLLKELHDLLGKLFDGNTESSGIVMASTIQFVDGLIGFLKDYSPSELVFPKKFVGHRHNIENSMTEKEQENVLLQFRRGQVNLLVSTDVTQEGLDIPHCNFVIRYNFVSNEIGSVQAKGRARAPDSKCFLIANSGSINIDREMKNIGKEGWMMDALDSFISSSSSDQLEELVKNRQKEMYRTLRSQSTPMEATATGDNGSSKYSLHCRRCKAFLCSTDQIVQYGSHYICTDDAFVERINVDRSASPKEFRDDTLTGVSVCRGCANKIGSVLTYKRGSRPIGYSLGKDSVMWKARETETYGAIKKWNQAPFVIRQEIRSLA